MKTNRASHIRRTLSPAAQQHVAEALRLLYSDAPGLAGDDALAERERLRHADTAGAHAQGVLPLPCAPSPREAAERARAHGEALNLNERTRRSAPGDGSSWPTPDAGNSNPVPLVDSAAGSY
ncbi:hypothetical protein [Xanthomonas vasicola]|uniref:hypothetical protein n=1 Tax=Xanthomonas vasicola TaxID=56459 RepID=UPI000531F18D|nr:hypothetical protein [Xanthomonas vasicola]KGR38543.1 hypothetical protein NX04_19985 [Xanthomonas vasicola]RNK73260.1 hypothetical protein C9390_19180 [Xanthomonas vasicola pv. vasculorum]RNL00623.1 hypothetical protein C9407_16480 [Xanthomonas vasicola pv. vasculorum]TWQ40816.1 hypothetical protein FQJ96_04860 [Xanthomonas vasicola]TWQ61217.1 hypothetical protein FQJ93_02680 [Xanthomonas vasicola]